MTPREIDNIAERVAEIVLDRMASRRPIEDGFVDKHEAAKILGCSIATIERWTASEEIPSHKIGGLRRYRASELLR